MAGAQRHAEIAGAGFVGLTLATALAQRGWSVRVHEQNDSMRDFGAGILIWRNAIMALETLGIAQTLKDRGMQPEFYDTNFNGQTAASELPGFPYWAIPRPKLHALLVDAAREAGAELVTGSTVVGARPGGEILLANGESRCADVVFGTDGAGSGVRNSIAEFVQERKKYRDGVVRVLIPRPKEFQGHKWDRVTDFWTLEPDAMRILFIPCGPESLYLGMMAESGNLLASQLPLHVETWTERFPHLASVIELAAKAEGSRHDAYQTNRVSRWSVGNVAIVGDAAHAMCPALGQGASVGMMNAVDLAAALDEYDTPRAALAEWEKRQRGVTDQAQSISGYMAETRTMAHGNGFSPEVLNIAAYEVPSLPPEVAALYPIPAEILAVMSK